jgi:hypothetical protein
MTEAVTILTAVVTVIAALTLAVDFHVQRRRAREEHSRHRVRDRLRD